MVAPLSTTMCPRRCNASRLERDMGLLAFAVRIRVRSCFDKPIVRISSEKLTVLLLDQLSCSAQLACSVFNRLTEGRTPRREYPMDDLVPCLCVLDSVCASGVSLPSVRLQLHPLVRQNHIFCAHPAPVHVYTPCPHTHR